LSYWSRFSQISKEENKPVRPNHEIAMWRKYIEHTTSILQQLEGNTYTIFKMLACCQGCQDSLVDFLKLNYIVRQLQTSKYKQNVEVFEMTFSHD